MAPAKGREFAATDGGIQQEHQPWVGRAAHWRVEGEGGKRRESLPGLTLKLVRHLRGGVIHEHAALGGGLEHEGVLAEAELSPPSLPPAVVVLQIHLLVDAVVVKSLEREGEFGSVGAFVGGVEQPQHTRAGDHCVVDPQRVVEAHGDELLADGDHLLQLVRRQEREPPNERVGAGGRQRRDEREQRQQHLWRVVCIARLRGWGGVRWCRIGSAGPKSRGNDWKEREGEYGVACEKRREEG